MNAFRFEGRLPASKSILNRLLIARSYEPRLEIIGTSECEDVTLMRSALAALENPDGKPIDCGAAGTVFRFVALRASRLPGEHRLTGTQRLLARPHAALLEILHALGVEANSTADGIWIKSRGWSEPDGALVIDRKDSSQFATSVLLNAWDLRFDLAVSFKNLGDGDEPLSEGYFAMTRKILAELGMRLVPTKTGSWIVRAGSQVERRRYEAEVDASSAFAIAALGALGGEAILHDFPFNGLQPDAVFPALLARMGATVETRGTTLLVRKAGPLKAIQANLRDCPDLFPVLGVLCAFAEGRSELYGAPHLALKESDRIASTAALVRALNRDVETKGDGMIVHGRKPFSLEWSGKAPFDFDPRADHRIAFATALASLAGAPVRCAHPHVVDKSFPGFWKLFTEGGGRLP